jgi:hypothetical protein
METQIFLVGYDRKTGFAGVIHAVPAVHAARARSISGLALDPAGDWPLSQDAALQVASLIEVEIDSEAMEFYLEPHQDPESTAASADEPTTAAHSK